jgi:hypothetical protein
VKNELSFPVEVYYRGDTGLQSCGVVEPFSETSLPLNAIYSLTSEIFFKPLGNR